MASDMFAPGAYGGAQGVMPTNWGQSNELGLMNQNQKNQQGLLAQQQGFQGQQSALDRALQQSMLGQTQGFQGQQAALDRSTQQGMQAAQSTLQQALLGQTQGFQGSQNALDRSQQLALQGNQLGFQGSQAALDRGQQLTMQGNQNSFQGQQSSLDRALQGQITDETLKNQYNIANLPIQFAQQRFNAILPMVSGAIGSATGGGGFGGAGGSIRANESGGQGASSSVLTPGQIDQQVNAMKAGNAQQAATQQRQNATQTASGGFGSNSPLLQALNSQASLGAMQANSSGEQQTRLNAAQMNAQQGVSAAQERDQANAQFQANAVTAQGNALQSRSSLIAALAGML